MQERFDWEQKEIRRMNDKDAKKQTLLEAKTIRQMEKTEKNFLRTIDVAENLEHQRRLKQQKQDFIYKKEYLKNAYNKEVQRQYESIIKSAKEQTWRPELTATETNPRMLVSMRNDKDLKEELRQRKVAEYKQWLQLPYN